MKSLLLIALLAPLSINASVHAQAFPTASRGADLQLGGGYAYSNSDYVPNNIAGFAFYADYDVLGFIGLEANFHRVKDPTPDPLVPSNHFSLRTYAVGGRYVRHYFNGRLMPYGKILAGRGVANFPAHERVVPGGVELYIDNNAYNLVSFGGGLDYRLKNRINLRVDFEDQHWFAHDPELPNGLSPYFFVFGAAYHFPARGPYKMSR